MKKQLARFSILLLGIVFILMFVYINNMNIERSERNPGYLSSYPNSGFYKIDPNSVLVSLAEENVDIFKPLLQEPDSVTQVSNLPISWSEGDFLMIASALGQLIWGDPMSIENWSVDSILFRTICNGSLNGFDAADITYFKPIEINGKKVYTTRHIEIDPYFGLVRWGSGAVYSRPIVFKWKSFDLTHSIINAEDALQIADKNGGKDARMQIDNKCSIFVSLSKDKSKWRVDYTYTSFIMLIDPYTGSYEVYNTNR